MQRRTFLKNTAAVPYAVPASVLGREGATSPSDRVALGVIGCGNQGTNDLVTGTAHSSATNRPARISTPC